MPSVSYGNTLTDLGRNIAEQKASEQALAGILAQVGAQKLAALNALAANRGRTQAERDVGMDRNATTRQVAVMESMLRAQELGDRDRQAKEAIAAAQELERIRGATNRDVAALPYGADALKMAEALARINAQTMNPRVVEGMNTENFARSSQNKEAEHIAMDASGLANFAYQDFIAESKGLGSDKKAKEKYDNTLKVIIAKYGDKSSLIRTVMLPGGRVRFEPLILPMISPQVPPVPRTDTGTTNAVPTPNMEVPQLPNIAPTPAPPMAVPRPGVADLRMLDEMAVPGVVAGNVASAADALAGEATGLATQSRSIIANSPFKELIPPSVFSDSSVRGGRRYGARTPEEQESVLRDYVGNLIRESARLSGMPANRGSAQRAQLLQSELARVKAILSSR